MAVGFSSVILGLVQLEVKWMNYCKKTKRKVISQAIVVPVSKFEKDSFWSEVQGLNMNPHCLPSSDDVGSYYGICRHDSHKGCAVVERLPSDASPQNSYNEFLTFVGFTKGKDINGFDVKEVPVWRVVPQAELKKAGLLEAQ